MPDAVTLLEILLRWIHFLAGVLWIGLLYFFNLVNVPVMKTLDAPTRGKVVPVLLPKALWYFRHAAWLTVLVGFIYWAFLIVPGDPAGDAHRVTIVWLVVTLIAWAVIYAFLQLPQGPPDKDTRPVNKGAVQAVLIGVVALLHLILMIKLTGGEGHSDRSVSIAIGGGLGLIMMMNVWGIIWRYQKRVIAWTRENAEKGTPIPPESAVLARRAFLASRTNAWLSVPMLFFMATASHGAPIIAWISCR